MRSSRQGLRRRSKRSTQPWRRHVAAFVTLGSNPPAFPRETQASLRLAQHPPQHPSSPHPPTPAHECSEVCTKGMCPRDRELYVMATSSEASLAIFAAYAVVSLSHFSTNLLDDMDELEMAELRFKQYLRRLHAAYPGEFSCFSQDSAKEMVEWTITIEASGMPLRSARLAAKEFGFKLEVAVACCAADMERARSWG